MVSGPPLTRSGGHCWFLGGVADSVEELVDAVQERAARGADWLKVMATGGFVTTVSDPWQLQYGSGPLAAVVAAVEHLGLPVTANAIPPPGTAAEVSHAAHPAPVPPPASVSTHLAQLNLSTACLAPLLDT
ncbi:hypothetical protein, partial [Siccibacter turicensis]|uniref:hypothetical protein n=1 Tax=Siccibacter turicensis TaxID=357233 RepID=UPI0034D3729D